MGQSKYGNFRLSKATIEMLSDLKLAFEVCYVKRLTNDEFIQKLVDCVEDGDCGVYDTYQEIIEKKQNAK